MKTVLMTILLLRFIRVVSSLVVAERSKAILTCSTRAVAWQLLSTNSTIISLIALSPDGRFECVDSWSVNGSCMEGIEIDTQDGKFIHFEEIHMENSGIYYCQTNSFNETTDVTVVGNFAPTLVSMIIPPPPAGASESEVMLNGKIELNCSTTYSGFTSPALIIVLTSPSGEQVVARSNSSTQMYFKLDVKVDVAFKYSPNGTWKFDISCYLETLRDHSSPDVSSKRYDVIYGPIFYNNSDNLTLPLVDGSVILNCSADGFIEVHYSWVRIDGFQRIDLHCFRKTYLADAPGDYECQPVNPRVSDHPIMKRFIVTNPTTPPSIVSHSGNSEKNPIPSTTVTSDFSTNRTEKGITFCMLMFFAIQWLFLQ